MSSIFSQLLLDVAEEIAVDLFAGGGGASLGYELATGRPVDIAINHDAAAVAMHERNHPQTYHKRCDIFEVCPIEVTAGRPVGHLWASPDCTFFSKARGGVPIRHRTKKRRALAWVVKRWAAQLAKQGRPVRVITMENVEEFTGWCRLVAKRKWVTEEHTRADGSTWESRRLAVIKIDPETGKEIGVAAKGEVVPIQEQALMPDPKQTGKRFRQWLRCFEALGFTVEWRELRACDFGAPTIRKRFFCIMRSDGRPIVWPAPTHADPKVAKAKGLKPWRTAAECIDWSFPMLSIFATKAEAETWGAALQQAAPKRPLAENTQRRIARGVKRYVIDNPKPYLVNVANSKTTGRGPNAWPSDEPLRTVTSSNGYAVVAPHVTKFRAGSTGHGMQEPLCTVTSNSTEGRPGGAAPIGIVAPVIVKNNHGEKPHSAADEPLKTIVAGGTHHSLVAPIIAPVTHQGERRAPSADEPLPTITCAKRGEMAVVAPHLVSVAHSDASPNGSKRWGKSEKSLEEPAGTLTASKDQALVVPYLTPRYGEREGQEPRVRSIEDPVPTVVNTNNGGSLVAAQISTYYGDKTPTDARGLELDQPLTTQPTENRHALVASFLAQNNGGFYDDNGKGAGRSIEEPQSTVLGRGHSQSLVSASLIKQRGTSTDADPAEPLDTISAGGLHHGIAAAHLSTMRNAAKPFSSPDEPTHTVTAEGAGLGVVAAFVGTENNGWENRAGRPLEDPAAAVCADGCKQSLCAAHVQRDFGQSVGSAADEPVGTVTGSGQGKAALVASFLAKYYGEGTGQEMTEPVHTVPTVDRFGVVTVQIGGETFVIEDIAMRMLQPRELYRAQGFPDSYVIDEGVGGRKLTKTEQVRMVGNSVCPPVAAALIRANVPEMVARSRKELARAT